MDLKKIVLSDLKDLVELYRQLHANPELSGQEKHTSDLIADRLENSGIVTTRNFGGYGVVGILENGEGPTVMVRADMDALPITEESGVDYASKQSSLDPDGKKVGIMHACGHDIHMTTLAGTAGILSKNKESWKGRILFVAQPAEESMSGALNMIKAGLFEKFTCPDFCLATHVMPKLESGKISVKPGPIMAGTFQLKIIVNGIGGHGAIPQESRDPIVLAARIISALQTIASREFNPLTPAVVTVGSIHGGTRANIIPDKVEMKVTARFFDHESRNRILDSIKRICRHEALAMNMPENMLPLVELDEETELPATINDQKMSETVKDAVCEQLGANNFTQAEMVMGSEDFALFRTAAPQNLPCCLFFTGATSAEEMDLLHQKGINPPSLHNCRFLPPPELTIKTAVTAMTATVLKLLSKGI